MEPIQPKTRVDAFITAKNYFNLLTYMRKEGAKTLSLAVNKIMQDYFLNVDEQQQAVERLNKVIQEQQNKIMNLEFEVRTKQLKEAKPVK